ncbi:hypothetical protein ABIE44_000997 [Marmoricola sp. OAE513]|uniref:aggregation-promoting factor C-terminal-like domain-containing protein n=1 Tax=Marmoricola sp. OAE513 TaxID=2817894 RepID=UPI001AEB336D
MPQKYVPTHRSAPPKRVRAGAKNAVYYSGVAMFATTLSVGAGVASGDKTDSQLPSLAADKSEISAADLSRREQSVSRSSDRTAARVSTATSLKAAELSTGNGVAVTRTEDLALTDPKALTRALMPRYGLASADFDCIDRIWTQESNWNVHADNPHSSAYGIPQALPGSKMASAGADWRNNPETQIRWGLGYIAKRYGTACSAWSFKRSHGWY